MVLLRRACNAIGIHVSSQGPVSVTSCAGFIGINMVTRLIDEVREILGVDFVTDIVYPSDGCLARLLAVRARSGFTFLSADFADERAQWAIATSTQVVNLARWSGQSQSWEYVDEYRRVYDLAATALFERCIESGVERFVQAST